jgi:hypothetical protein
MLRTLGITGLGPKKENRIIFYSILALLILTLLYVISFYGEEEEKGTEREEKERSGQLQKNGTKKDPEASFSWQGAEDRLILARP